MTSNVEDYIGRTVKRHASVAAKLREQVALDATIQNDPKYRKYAQQVEKCLASFESMVEWPDFIAFLKQLLKTLQSYTQFKQIPRKLIVAKRLSQCLIPALPSGVHTRALDVYTHILGVLGPDGLKRDLPLWSSGLFPFFEYASTSVKPVVLGLFECYYIPLQDELRPATRSFILALLPGLEEETSEFFEKVVSLLDRLSGTVSPAFFLQNIWLVMLTSPGSRAYCLNYLARRLPRLNANEDITTIVGRDIGLMIRAFAAALEDDNLLVQRGALDLLLQALRAESAALTGAPPHDRALLMRAATGVVLRRDLSLNRRLFSWLLGPEESTEKQGEYYRKYTLGLLVETLKDEMYRPSTQYSSTRPFKIYVSLLDKWEIGAPLTEVLIYDALESVKKYVDENADASEEVLITANSMYEAVEPRAIWKQLFKAIRKEILTSDNERECIDMFIFVLSTFRTEDEEVQNVHLPLVFCATVEILEEISRKMPRRVTTSTFRAAMELLDRMAVCTPVSVMSSPLQLVNFAFGGSFDDAALAYYGIEEAASVDVDASAESPAVSKERRWSSVVPFIASFEHLADLAMLSAELFVSWTNDSTSTSQAYVQDVFVHSVSLLLKLTASLSSLVSSHVPTPLTVSWDVEPWLDCISRPLDLPACTFQAADKVVSLAISLHSTSVIQPTPSIDNRSRLSYMMHAFMCYLRPSASPYHVRAVQLIWELEHATSHHHIESIIAQKLAKCSSQSEYEAYDAFGVLWRLSDDSQQPGIHFKIPMLAVLDTLSSTNPILRRVGETWMRCNLRTYPRVLDPILLELLDPRIYITPSTIIVEGRELQCLEYDRPFDSHRVTYLLGILLHVVRFGGLNFNKVISSSHVSRSSCAHLVERVARSGFTGHHISYGTVIVETLLRFLHCEPKQLLQRVMQGQNVEIQSIVIDLLQCLVSRGDVDALTIDTMESAVVTKLFLLVHSERLELQNKLLHLLHSIISISSASAERRHLIRSPNMMQQVSSDTLDTGTVKASMHADPNSPTKIHPLLVNLLIDGIATPSNRRLLHHWLDFVLLTVPQFPYIIATAISPLNACVCRQMRNELTELNAIVASANGTQQRSDTLISSVDDAELVMLLNALERLVLLSLNEMDSSIAEDNSPVDRPGDGAGLLSIVSNVFSNESSNHTSDAVMTARSPAYRSLHDGIGVLYATWKQVSVPLEESHPAFHTLDHIFHRTSLRCRKAFEKLFRTHAFEVIESVIQYWSIDRSNNRSTKASFEIVDFLTASAQNVVHMVCESISWRISTGSGERTKKQVLNPELSDAGLFAFLEDYLSRLENPLALQVWTRYQTLAKDIAANVKEFRLQAFPVLRCTTVLALKISQTTALEDRRMRKDLQELYGKLLDACVLLAGNSFDQGIWPRRAKETLVVNGSSASLSRSQSETNLSEKDITPHATTQAMQKAPVADLSEKIDHYLAYDVLPEIKRLLIDNDKILGACNNIVYYILNPALKNRSKLEEVDDIFIAIMEQMSKIPAAVKSWKNPAVDVFNDNKLFAATPGSGLKWRSIIKTLIDTDKTALSELLGKIASTPSAANIFSSREYELQMKAQNIRRLSFVLFASEKNHFLTQLPAIQEKLVDILRSGSAAILESEVYLCIRVLMCRLSPHNLSSFWPVLLAELIRVFETLMAEPPLDGTDTPQLILSACKLVDLLLVLQTEEFQIHQWIFVTDTVDAIYRPDDWFPEAMMDQLSEVVGDLPASENRKPSGISLPDAVSANGARQPLLRSVKQIESIQDLAPFFSHLSIMAYEGVYASSSAIDWEAVENSLVEDIFDGR